MYKLIFINNDRFRQNPSLIYTVSLSRFVCHQSHQLRKLPHLLVLSRQIHALVYDIGHSPETIFRRPAIEHVSRHGSLTLPSSSGGATPNLNCRDWYIHTQERKINSERNQTRLLTTKLYVFDKLQVHAK